MHDRHHRLYAGLGLTALGVLMMIFDMTGVASMTLIALGVLVLLTGYSTKEG